MKWNLLFVDDDTAYLDSLKRRLMRSTLKSHFNIRYASGGEQALLAWKDRSFQVMVTDLKMPGIDGRALADKVFRDHPDCYVLMMTAYSDVKEAVGLIRQGFYDYLVKPFEFEELEYLLERIRQEGEKDREITHLREEIQKTQVPKPDLIYASRSMENIQHLIDAAGHSDFPVLILGESGTGKEVVADTIHYMSNRSNGPYVKVNCAGIVEGLLESEMFGHEKGAFTGATDTKPGKFEQAHEGTLFLDEIGDMAFGLQAKMLRTVQNGIFQRVGGLADISTNVRIVAATNTAIQDAIKEGRFRQDLYYRLNIITISIPPLRERKEDIPLLATYFLARNASRYGKTIESISPEVLARLNAYNFPGNVRELENIIARTFALSRGNELQMEDLPDEIRGSQSSGKIQEKESNPTSTTDWDLEQRLEMFERQHILQALEKTENNRSETARLLGISRRKLYYKLSKHNIGETYNG